VEELIDTLSFTRAPNNVQQIFRIVAHYWVDAQAAGRLPPLLTASERRTAALNGALVSRFNANACVRRAHPRDQGGQERQRGYSREGKLSASAAILAEVVHERQFLKAPRRTEDRICSRSSEKMTEKWPCERW
jgi:hypothetical protein